MKTFLLFFYLCNISFVFSQIPLIYSDHNTKYNATSKEIKDLFEQKKYEECLEKIKLLETIPYSAPCETGKLGQYARDQAFKINVLMKLENYQEVIKTGIPIVFEGSYNSTRIFPYEDLKVSMKKIIPKYKRLLKNKTPFDDWTEKDFGENSLYKTQIEFEVLGQKVETFIFVDSRCDNGSRYKNLTMPCFGSNFSDLEKIEELKKWYYSSNFYQYIVLNKSIDVKKRRK